MSTGADTGGEDTVPWLLPLVTCLDCGGELQASNHSKLASLLRCEECDLSWPVLAGIPVLVPDPGEYLCRYRDSVLAALAEVGHATREVVSLVDEFTAGYVVRRESLWDDWTEDEGAGTLNPSKTKAQWTRLCGGIGKELDPHQTIVSFIGEACYGTVYELGPGAGLLSRHLAKRAQHLVLIDHSLRSLFRARRRAQGNGAQVAAVVADAQSLEMASESASAVVSANLIDLLDRPESFLSAAARWLEPGGDLFVSTPDPSFGTETEDALREMVEFLEYEVVQVRDQVPWLRVHTVRHAQLYLTQVLQARSPCVSQKDEPL